MGTDNKIRAIEHRLTALEKERIDLLTELVNVSSIKGILKLVDWPNFQSF